MVFCFSLWSSHNREELKVKEHEEEHALGKDAYAAPRMCFLVADTYLDKHSRVCPCREVTWPVSSKCSMLLYMLLCFWKKKKKKRKESLCFLWLTKRKSSLAIPLLFNLISLASVMEDPQSQLKLRSAKLGVHKNSFTMWTLKWFYDQFLLLYLLPFADLPIIRPSSCYCINTLHHIIPFLSELS